ncbi:MAG: peptidase dimerization domain-containing protein [Candidatus Heimdallarchaeota archaeon]
MHLPEVHGDCCLSGEPGSPYTIRFGEKGSLWLAFEVHTLGSHGAYTHASPSAIKIASRLIKEVKALTMIEVSVPENIVTTLKRTAKINDMVYGKGASEILDKITVNIGSIRGD